MRGLQSKLLFLCTGMLVTFAAVSAFMYQQSVVSKEKGLAKSVEASAQQLEYGIGAQFFERYGDIQAFGLNSIFYGKDLEGMRTALTNYAKLYVIYDLILFVDKNGKLIASNFETPAGKAVKISDQDISTFANQEWFKAPLSGRTLEDKDRAFTGTYFEDFHVNEMVKRSASTDGYVSVFSAVVKDEKGNVLGVMANFANWSWVGGEMKAAGTGAIKAGLPYVEMHILNKKGQILFDYEPHKSTGAGELTMDFEKVILKDSLLTSGDEAVKTVMEGKNGTMIYNNKQDGKLSAAGFAPVANAKFPPSIGWSAIATLEAKDLFAEIHATRTLFFAICGGMLLLSIGFGAWFATRLVKSLQSVASGMTESGEAVNAASSELQSASQQVSGGATQAASSLEETVASLEELTSMVRLNSDNAAQAASLAQGSSKTAADGEGEIKALIGSITEISQSSQKIEDIINVIDDIAFQTNLLALNAAVEAARAGEQGKGFAVVAEAVRTLAQRSATAAKEISTLIRDNVSKIENGTKLADRSGAVLKEILVSVRKVADISNEIAAASQEQSTGLAQISKAMNELDQSTQRNAATSEEVAASAETMNQQASTLKSLTQELAHVIYGHANSQPAPSPEPTRSRPQHNTRPMARPPVRLASKPQFGKSLVSSHATATSKKGKSAEEIIPMMDEEQNNQRNGNFNDVSGF